MNVSSIQNRILCKIVRSKKAADYLFTLRKKYRVFELGLGPLFLPEEKKLAHVESLLQGGVVTLDESVDHAVKLLSHIGIEPGRLPAKSHDALIVLALYIIFFGDLPTRHDPRVKLLAAFYPELFQEIDFENFHAVDVLSGEVVFTNDSQVSFVISPYKSLDENTQDFKRLVKTSQLSLPNKAKQSLSERDYQVHLLGTYRKERLHAIITGHVESADADPASGLVEAVRFRSFSEKASKNEMIAEIIRLRTGRKITTERVSDIRRNKN